MERVKRKVPPADVSMNSGLNRSMKISRDDVKALINCITSDRQFNLFQVAPSLAGNRARMKTVSSSAIPAYASQSRISKAFKVIATLALTPLCSSPSKHDVLVVVCIGFINYFKTMHNNSYKICF